MRPLALLFLLLFHSLCQAFTFGPTSSLSAPEFLPVDQAFQLSISTPKDGKLTATWQIQDGYYLYQEQFSLSGEQAHKLHFSPFPTGESQQDPYYGDVIVYRDQLSLPIYYDITLTPGTEINAILTYQGCADKGLCYAPQAMPIQFTVPALSPEITKNNTQNLPRGNDASTVQDKPLPLSEAQTVSQLISTNTLWTTLAVMFGLGLLLSFTPCVLPMIPIVSAIVIGSRHSKLGGFYYSAVYVFAMALTYAMIGGLVGIFGTQLNVQAQLQNPVLLMISALLFVLLALAMFGVYELRLPSAWQQRLQMSNSVSNSAWRSSLSVFVAGVLSTLIVSPCVSAPLAGALLFISSQGNAWYGAMILFVMALGMGVPLLLVGAFGPKILPKSGEWLQDIKVLMGFGLLAMAIWLLTRWIPLNSHLYLWGALAIAISSYFVHRTQQAHSHPVRWFFALLFFIVGSLQFIGATTGNSTPLSPLKNISSSSITPKEQVVFDATITNLDELNNIIANQDTRPIVLDLYADWCVSCRVLEEMFVAPDVLPLIKKVQLIRVDVTKNSAQNQALMQHFHLFGPPSLVFLDQEGNERKALTLMGEPTKSTLINRLEAITLP